MSRILRNSHISGWLATAILLPVCFARAPSDSGIVVTEGAGTYEVTIGPSHLVLLLPKGVLHQGQKGKAGETALPNYFCFAGRDDTKSQNASGWLSPGKNVRGDGGPTYWKHMLDGLIKANFHPIESEFFVQGGWDVCLYAIRFDTPPERLAPNQPAVFYQEHLRANYIKDGTWIDLHLSVLKADGSRERARKDLLEWFSTIVVKEKPGHPLPTPVSVTPAAGAPVAPPSGAGHS